MNSADSSRARQILSEYRPGYSLPRAFYHDEALYRAEVEAVWRRGWLFVGHRCEVPRAGDYLTYEVDGDSLLLVRQDDGTIRAMHNVCRHRGTRLCRGEAGHVGRVVCPYHQWVYGRDGSLISCRGMHEGIDKTEWSLKPVHLTDLEGFLFVSLADEPPDFELARQLMAPLASPQGLGEAKVAKTVEYRIDANWKLVWENNRECYHCNVNHPEYIKANYDAYNEDDTTERIREKIAAAVAASESRWAAAGLAVTHDRPGMAYFPDPEHDCWYSANRTPLVEGFLTESLDGRLVAPLMGRYTSPEVGTLRLRTVPNFWNHSSCDHSVSTRLTPAGIDCTLARVTWLVHRDAEEGRDYQLDELMPFWQRTSEQDWELCRQAQRGVTSRAYEPGLLSRYKEYNVERFLRWYVDQLEKYLPG